MGPRAQVIAQGTRVFLSFPETIDMVSGHCLIVPNEHVLTLLDCDDDEWTEIRNFQKSVIRMFDALNQGNKDIIYD
jgi:diadenosine tetraphosphate (Ap4A) HIT family hydrolase